jgi:hypothetical protein
MFPTERSGVPMFGMDTPVDRAAARRQTTQAPEGAAAAVLSDPTYQQFVGEPRRKLEKAQSEFGAFEGEMAADTAAREARKAERERAAFGTYAQAVEAPELRAERTAAEEAAAKPFVPTQENVQDMAAIFSLIGVLGFAIGAGGKNNAIGAMNAMNGMMQGYQQGRQDRYLREKDLFESNAKALKTKIDSLNNRMNDIAKLAAVNMEKANMEADMLFAQEGADFLKKYKDKMGLVNTIKMLQEQVKGGEKMYEFIEKERSRAAEKEAQRKFQERMQEDRQQAARDLRVLAAANRQPKYQLIEQDGKVLAVDMSNPMAAPVELPGIKAGGKKFGAATRGGAANDRYAFNIHESALQATTDLLNITNQPADTVLGTFAGMTGKSGETLTSALRNTFARKLTSSDQRQMQQMIAGLEYNMGRALGGGYANSSAKAVLDIYKQQVAQAGDSPAAQAMFLARMKQELKILFKAFKNHPGSNAGYVEDLSEASKALDDAIPFDVKDVTTATRGTRQTFVDKYVPTMEGAPRLSLPSTETQTQTQTYSDPEKERRYQEWKASQP